MDARQIVEGRVVHQLSGEQPEARPLRADAARNRQRILDAAEEVFAKEGLSVPIDAVASVAGVGVGTLYRHFPTKEALFQAIVISRLTELVEAARAGADADPGEAFFSFLDRMADEVRLKQDLFEALGDAGIDVKSSCGELMEELESGVDKLRERAVDAGVLRDDVTTQQAIGLVVGTCMASRRPDMALGSQQMLKVVYDGLRQRTG